MEKKFYNIGPWRHWARHHGSTALQRNLKQLILSFNL